LKIENYFMFTRSQIIFFSAIGGVVVLAALLFIGILPGKRDNQPPPKPVTLTFWGVFDTAKTYEPLIQSYQKSYRHVTINYIEKPAATYENDLLQALARGEGPDIFMMHNRWLPRWQDKIAPVPETYYTPQTFDRTFADVASADLVRDDKVWALPLSIDTLALFYNRDLFNNARIVEPPKTWEAFLEAVRALTRRDDAGNITRAGAALGAAENVNRAADILTLLMMQSGSTITDPKTGRAAIQTAKRSLEFLTDFANPARSIYTWNRRQHNSIDAFIEGRAAMMLNYGYQIPIIKARAPQLRFAAAPAPQESARDLDVTLANYWAYTVNKASPNALAAWHFLASSVEKEALKTYLDANGRASARNDILPEQFSDPLIGPFASQVPVARSYQAVDNFVVEKAFEDMIESVVKEEKIMDRAIQEAVQKINATAQ
jgi:multiple sugar transport system substrate-binding protein